MSNHRFNSCSFKLMQTTWNTLRRENYATLGIFNLVKIEVPTESPKKLDVHILSNHCVLNQVRHCTSALVCFKAFKYSLFKQFISIVYRFLVKLIKINIWLDYVVFNNQFVLKSYLGIWTSTIEPAF